MCDGWRRTWSRNNGAAVQSCNLRAPRQLRPLLVKIALVTLNDPDDVHQWSGLNHHIARSLEDAGATLVRVGSLRSRWTLPMRARQRLSLLGGRTYHANLDPAALRAMGEDARSRIPEDADAVLAITSLVAAALGPLDRPFASWDDATWAAMLDYYPDFQTLASVSRRQARAAGLAAARAVDLAVYSSHWAAASATRDYGLAADQVAVVPFGANLAVAPDRVDVDSSISRRLTGPLRLLWIGVEWERKGGQFTLQVADALRRIAGDVQLSLVGVAPPAGTTVPPWVTVEGFLSKRDPLESRRLAMLLAQADFFVMPSRAEAYGLVYAEAAAYGVPAAALRTGGVLTIIEDGVTGLLFGNDADPEAWAGRLHALARDRTAYQAMCAAARARYDERLNWRSAGRHMLSLLRGLTGRGGDRAVAAASPGTRG